MILLAIDPVSFSSARVSNGQHLNVAGVLSKYADLRKAYHSSILDVEVKSRKSAGIGFYFHQYVGNGATKSFRSIGRLTQIPIDCLVNFVRCFFAKANHLPSLLSIFRLTSSHGMPGEGSFALLSNSWRNAGSSTENLAGELSMESSNSVASKIRSPSGSASADLKSSSCDIDMTYSIFERYVPNSILIETACLLSQSPQVVFELGVDLFETSFDLLLTRSVATGGNEELVPVGADLERSVCGDMEHIQDWFVDDESQAVSVFDQHFLHLVIPLPMVTQSVYRNSGEGKLSLNASAVPTAVLEQIHILGAAVSREFVKGGSRRHDYRAISVGESFGRSVVSERSNIAACDQRACRLDRCVMFFEDSAGMVLVAIEVKIDSRVATNHWFDCLVGSAVAASMLGVVLFGTDRDVPEKRNRLSFKEMQGRRRG